MIKTDRLSIRRVRTDDWIAIQDIWADAAKSFYAQYDKPNALDDQSVSLRISKWAMTSYSRAVSMNFFCTDKQITI